MNHQITFTVQQEQQLEEMLKILGVTAWSKKITDGILIYYFGGSQQGCSAVSICRDYIPAKFIAAYNERHSDTPLYQLFPLGSSFDVFLSFLHTFVVTNAKGEKYLNTGNPKPIAYTADNLLLLFKMLEWCAKSIWVGANRGLAEYYLLDGVMVYDVVLNGIPTVITADELLYFILYKTQFKWNRTFPLDSRSPIHPQFELLDYNKLFSDIWIYENVLSKNFARNSDKSFLIQLK